MPSSAHDALARFHPLIRTWFSEQVGTPTPIQQVAWPIIAEGSHVLLTAPTGSGKTLTAFLWAIDQLARRQLPTGTVRVLYVSPLKALNNDIARNLLGPLTALNALAVENDVDWPDIRVMTRSGDTPEADRRRMASRPPEILITTPESLNLLLVSQRGRNMLGGVHSVILDEIHAIAGDKRGTYLMTAIERLTRLSGEFQRIALSATVRPLERVAELVGGFAPRSQGGYEARPVRILQAEDSKRIELQVCCPEDLHEKMADRKRLPAIIDALKDRIDANRSTLIFTNNRKLTEKTARLINLEADTTIAYSHHGSLSREVRQGVEERFKAGELAAIVATNSLELGIDIGALDEVVLLDSPRTLASGVQRVGRAGHNVGDVSRGRIYPLHEHGFVDAAVMARLITEKACEETRPVRAPLDVLAQVIVAMCVVEDWEIDALFAFICSCWSYQTLARRDFDLVLEMLAGRYADSQIRELVPRLRIDRVSNKVTAKDGARLLLYRAGGVIPDRGYFNIRLQESGALIGQLDEEFVWERRIGDEFTIGTQPWKIARITHQDVLVIGAPKLGMAPFWRGESIDRDWALCEQIGLFLEEATARFKDPAWPAEVARRHHLDPHALDELMLHLGKQRDATGPILPHRHHVLVEHYDDPSNSLDSKRVILHAQWGGRILRPLAICISAAWEERHGTRLEVMADDECLGLTLPVSFSVDDLLNLIPVEKIEPLLRGKLEATGFFGARFRENAARALLLPRKSLKKRMPLWLNRLRSKKLIEAVSRYEDFPILVETWRSCLHDHFDLDGLRDRLTELREGVIQVSEAVTKMPSPFADNVVWRSTDSYMYLDDTPQGSAGSKLSGTLIRELMNSSALRPRIPRALADALQQKLHRTHVDYAPSDAAELVDLVEERLLIPWDEWLTLRAAIQRDHDVDLDALLEAASERLVRVELPGARTDAVVLIDRLPRLLRGLGLDLESVAVLGLVRPGIPDAIAANLARLSLDVGALSLDEPGEDSLLERQAELLSELLRHYAVVERARLGELVGLGDDALEAALELLLEQGEVVCGSLLDGSLEFEVCDAENLERLLRLHRTAQRPQLEPLPLDALPLFLAALHGLTARGESLEDLQVGLERLFGYGAPAAAWEREFLPARMDPYHLAWLDSSLQNSDLIWFGCGHEQVAFCFRDWLDLYRSAAMAPEEACDESDSATPPLFPTSGRFELETVRQLAGLDSDTLHEALWSQVWAGALSSESLASLRSGLLTKFKPEPMSAAPQRRRTGGWRSLKASTGAWFALHDLEDSGNARAWDELDEEEARRDRVRQLFSRYGVLFKERLSAELPALQWRSVQRTLRLMEFSGEAISGHFFKGVFGLQFTDHAGLRALRHELPEEAIYWLNALDPISPCGLGLSEWRGRFPPRVGSTHLVFRGRELVMVSKRLGRAIELFVAADDPRLPEVLQVFKDLLSRQFDALKSVLVETINDEPAHTSPFAPALRAFGFVKDFRQLALYRRF